VLRYILGSVDFILDYVKGDRVSLVGYTDSDQAGCAIGRESTSRCYFGLGLGDVSWFSWKLRSVALSWTKVEYMETSQASFEAI
jgi:hypothetical protein